MPFRYVDGALSIDNPHFASWISLIFSKELEIKETQKQLPLSPFLTFFSNLTIAIFLPYSMTKETTSSLP